MGLCAKKRWKIGKCVAHFLVFLYSLYLYSLVPTCAHLVLTCAHLVLGAELVIQELGDDRGLAHPGAAQHQHPVLGLGHQTETDQ